jgi:para-nitrobenzyl esterase
MKPRDLPMGLCLVHVLASWTRLAAVAVPLLAAMHGAADADDMRVRTQSGIVEGVVEADVMSFKGIAYAAPPVGELRWKEPRSPGSWDGTREADAYGNACIQTTRQFCAELLRIELYRPHGSNDSTLSIASCFRHARSRNS